MIKLILLVYSMNAVSLTDVNIGDIRTPAGFYFSTMEKCEETGNEFIDKRPGFSYKCLEIK